MRLSLDALGDRTEKQAANPHHPQNVFLYTQRAQDRPLIESQNFNVWDIRKPITSFSLQFPKTTLFML